jgi:CheY-like chemotaxis protein
MDLTRRRQSNTGDFRMASAIRITALVADDDPIFRSLIVARLSAMGTAVLEAGDGSEAWRAIQDADLSLAVVDLEMPGIDGMTLIQVLRSHPRTRHVPIVVCTSRESLSAMHAAVEAGASTFLNKPLNWSMFEGHIRHLMATRQASMAAADTIANLTQRLAEREAVLRALSDELSGRLARMWQVAANGPEYDAMRREIEGGLSRIDAVKTALAAA